MLLRDIIDLDATHGGVPGANNLDEEDEDEDPENQELPEQKLGFQPDVIKEQKAAPPTTEPNDNKSEGVGADDENGTTEDDEDDEDAENNLSLAAMEAKLTPEVLENFGEINKTYKKLHKLQLIRLEAMQGTGEIKPCLLYTSPSPRDS